MSGKRAANLPSVVPNCAVTSFMLSSAATLAREVKKSIPNRACDALMKSMRVSVAKQSQIGGMRRTICVLRDCSHQPFLCRVPQHAMIREVHPSQKIHAGCDSGDRDLLGMKFEMQAFAKELSGQVEHREKIRSVMREDDKVIGVADVLRCFEKMFGELVERIHVDVGEQLRGEIAERQADSGTRR